MTDVLYDDVLIHWGVKGMKWGVRKDKAPKQTRLQKNEERFRKKGHSSRESTRLAKSRIKKQNVTMVAGGLAIAAAAAYVAADIAIAKRKLTFDKQRTEQGLALFDKADELIAKGESFVRSSYGNESAWNNPIRTYAMRSSDVAASQHYGNQHFSLKTNSRSRIAGLQKQLDILNSSDAKPIRDAYLNDLLRKNPVGRAVVSRTNTSDISKSALSYINRTGYGAATDTSSGITKQFVDKLLDKGYSAVRDTNHATSPAYVLLNRSSFDISNLINK